MKSRLLNNRLSASARKGYYTTAATLGAALASVAAASAQTTTSVPAVDYTQAMTDANGAVTSTLTTNAPKLIGLAIAFSVFAWVMMQIKMRTRGQ